MYLLLGIAIIASWGFASLMVTIAKRKGWNATLVFWLSIDGWALIVLLIYGFLTPDLHSTILGLLAILGILSMIINYVVRLTNRDALSKSTTHRKMPYLNESAPLKDESPLPDKSPVLMKNKRPKNPRTVAKSLNPIHDAKLGQIFISYRRSDSADIAGRIYDRLVGMFGKEPIFKDVDSIPLGIDFKEYLDQKVGECDVLLAIIGDRWIDASDITGASRLYDPTDFVRIEIQSALERGIPVIPLLVRGAQMPVEESLPTSLRKLTFRNGILIRSDPDFHRDMDRLIAALEKYVKKENKK
jgi:hypothetical protein